MSEFLSRDILEESFVRSFAPFRFVQRLLGSCRVDARDLFVTPPTVWQKTYSIIMSIATLYLFIILVEFYHSRELQYTNVYYICAVSFVFDYLVYCALVFHVRFLHNNENVKFFIKFHEIDRKLNIDKTSYLNNFLFKVNIGTLSIASLIGLLLFAFSIFDNYTMTLYGIGEFFSQITCTVEWMHYSNIILFFYTRIYCINSMMMNHLNLDHDSYVKTFHLIFLDKETVQQIVAELNDFRSSNIVECFKELLDALRTFTILYRFQMLLLCLKAVVQTILFVSFYILTAQNKLQVTQEHIFLPVIWLTNVVVLIFICLRWQKFFGEIEDTKHLCTKVIATHKGLLRKKAARIIKIIEETPPRFSVYDMWNMDTSLLLKMFNIMTTIIITIFQFALL